MDIKPLLAGRLGLAITIVVVVVAVAASLLIGRAAYKIADEQRLFDLWRHEMKTDDRRDGWRCEHGPSGVP